MANQIALSGEDLDHVCRLLSEEHEQLIKFIDQGSDEGGRTIGDAREILSRNEYLSTAFLGAYAGMILETVRRKT